MRIRLARGMQTNISATANEGARPRVAKVGILDCDYHYGNGTDDILAQLRLSYVDHYTTGRIGGPKT